jgi:AcrR family transcriptional regulator
LPSESRARGERAEPLAPLYERLPHGPHKLDAHQVARHQRRRIHGAMVEAVAANGYAGTSVTQVVALAGVSRRAFYEQFSNKEDCFLVTFDLIAARGIGRLDEAYRAADGDLSARLRACLNAFGETVCAHADAAGLAITTARTAGSAGVARTRRALATLERMLCESFAHTPGGVALPTVLARSIVGGLYALAWLCLREGDLDQMAAVNEQMLAWTLIFQAPVSARLAPLLGRRASAHLARRASRAESRDATAADRGGARDERGQLLESALALATESRRARPTAAEIAERAQLSLDTLFAHFADGDACVLSAVGDAREQLLAVVTDPQLAGRRWPRAVRRAIARLMAHLESHPLHARAIAAQPLATGHARATDGLELARAIVAQLTDALPKRARGQRGEEAAPATTAAAGALWHVISCQVAASRIQLLPALSDHLAYVVLAPLSGAEAAAATLADAPSRWPAGAPPQSRRPAARRLPA